MNYTVKYGKPLSQIAAEHDIKLITLYKRLEKGMTLEEALSTEVICRKFSPGVTDPDSIASKARAAGLEPYVVYNRLSNGKTLEEALALNQEKTMTYKAREAGMSKQLLKKRLKQGMTMEEALAKPVKQYKKRNPDPMMDQGLEEVLSEE